MKPVIVILSLVLLSAVVFAGCRQAAEKSQAKSYPIKGKVVAVDAGAKSVTRDHENIPGLMQAMEMEFQVADPKALDGLKAGDQVQGRLEDRRDGQVIVELKKD
jgi:Cu/Ag efflux protein CusF